jgi:hypothetical protein
MFAAQQLKMDNLCIIFDEIYHVQYRPSALFLQSSLVTTALPMTCFASMYV